MNKRKLTDKQQATLDFIDKFQKENERIPALKEIAEEFGTSISNIQLRLGSLYRHKVLERKNIFIIKNN